MHFLNEFPERRQFTFWMKNFEANFTFKDKVITIYKYVYNFLPVDYKKI